MKTATPIPKRIVETNFIFIKTGEVSAWSIETIVAFPGFAVHKFGRKFIETIDKVKSIAATIKIGSEIHLRDFFTLKMFTKNIKNEIKTARTKEI